MPGVKMPASAAGTKLPTYKSGFASCALGTPPYAVEPEATIRVLVRMTDLAKDPALDATVPLLREGYRFVSRRCKRLGADAFETRLMGRRVVCARGRDAAAMFYHPDRFTRRGAMPRTALKLLQDDGSVQSLDGAAHRHRKMLFMGLMTCKRIAELTILFERAWTARRATWANGTRLVLHDEVCAMLTHAACIWAGVPQTLEGPRHWRARWLRRRSERWAREAVEDARSGAAQAGLETAVRAIATHRGLDGRLLPAELAAVELLNVARPIVAVGRFVVFSALALHRNPEWAAPLRNAPEAISPFVQEVRRTAPFFPLIAGRVREPFSWRGHAFAKEDWMVLDIYGTNRDAGTWPSPEDFDPARFTGREIDPFDMIPQGGGEHATSHRCPGEWITIALMEEAVRRLLDLDACVPDQDLSIDLARMPALPTSGFVVFSGRCRRSTALFSSSFESRCKSQQSTPPSV